MSDVRSIKKFERAEIQVDAQVSARIVESIVTKGDISDLNTADRARYYIQMCESLGLNPATQPLAPLKLNGKEILYPTRGATDQLAAMHRLNREIVDGPRIIDIAGVKMAYAMCRATHPNGRIEQAVATLPVVDPANLYMKLETKAKRRATLSILGLGWLDETEIDGIPARLRAPGQPVQLPAGHTRLDELRDALTDGDTVSTFEAAVAAYDETVGLSSDQDMRAEGLRACYAHLEEELGQKSVRVRFKAAIDALEGERAAQKRALTEQAAAAAVASTTMPPALVAFVEGTARIELPGEAVALWIKHRGDLSGLAPTDREAAWKALCKRTEEVGKMKNAKVWLKRAIAEEDERKGRDEGPPFSGDDDDRPRGGGAPAPANDAPADADADPERESIQAEASDVPAGRAWIQRAVGFRVVERALASWAAHRSDFGAEYDRVEEWLGAWLRDRGVHAAFVEERKRVAVAVHERAVQRAHDKRLASQRDRLAGLHPVRVAV